MRIDGGRSDRRYMGEGRRNRWCERKIGGGGMGGMRGMEDRQERGEMSGREGGVGEGSGMGDE